ncbi:MAG: sigma-70 family RNA polymerase sigma factor [Anaerolineae bacterium]
MNGTEPADAILLADLRAGSETAYEALFRRYYEQVYGIVHRLSPDKADDLAQEVFLRLYRRPPSRGDSNLPAWLHRVAVNVGYNALRGAGRRGRGMDALRADIEADWLLARSVREPEACAERREVQKAVRATLRRLGKRQAALLVLRHAGLSYREIAGVLGVAPGSVGTLLARAEKAFLRAYASGGGQGG